MTIRNKVISILLLSTIIAVLYFVLAEHIDKETVNEEYKASVDMLNIKFEDISTDSKIYDRLLEESDKFIGSDGFDTTKVDTSVDISEETYVDSRSIKLEVVDDTFHRGDPIYFNDATIVSYVNEKGELVTVGAKYSTNTDSVDCSTNLSKIFESKALINENLEYDRIVPSNSFEISELNYERFVASILLDIMNNEMNSDKMSIAMHYFNLDGWADIDVDETTGDNNKLKIKFIESGKSSIDADKKDRVLIGLYNDNINTTIILKLNNKNMIFDVDII